ncbi:MAG: hypothetical protein KF781_06650 [Chitinophagaceae bacterium]|nr:hypothetical protein [Chitinophagaceae bacterium]MCW5904100.1 hypothetical protein [Chitinophagaceae bacterium]
MKKNFFLFIIALAVVVVSCNLFGSYGKKITISDKVEVYIKGDSVSEEVAKKLGTYLDTTWKDLTNKRSFQLTKENGVYNVHMVVDEKTFKEDASLEVSFMALRLLIAMNVFPDSKVNLVLTDNTFKPYKTYSEDAATEAEETAPSTTK